jgi:hypothetical protein
LTIETLLQMLLAHQAQQLPLPLALPLVLLLQQLRSM